MLPILLGGGVAAAAYLHYKRRYRPTPPTLEGSSAQLQTTAVLPHLDSPIPPGQNAIWCITLELAWRRAMEQIFGGPICLANTAQLPEQLNQSKASWNGLPPEMLELNVSVRENAAVKLYHLAATLNLSLPFEIPFSQNRERLYFNGGPAVRSFGTRPNEVVPGPLRNQVAILYARDDEFIVDPFRTSERFQLILASIERQPTLLQTVQKSEEYVTTYRPFGLGRSDSLLIPEQSWDVKHIFPELCAPVLDKPAELNVQQRVRFRLDRNGAELFSSVDLLAPFMKGAPSHYHFLGPHLLYIRSKDTGQLIFAQWIENSELLVPF